MTGRRGAFDRRAARIGVWAAAIVVASATLSGTARAEVPAAPSAVSSAVADPDPLRQAQIDDARAQARYYAKQAEKDRSGDLPAWLQTLLGGFVAIVGGLVATWYTNRAASRKEQGQQRQTYDRQRGQLRLALRDLATALRPVAQASADRPAAFLAERLLYTKPPRPASGGRTDDYYLKYDLVDTIYRFCALLGWMELYRTDADFLRGTPDENARLERFFAGLRADLGQPLTNGGSASAADATPRDGFILEDDQRAIGEKMLARRRSDVVIGYAAFCEQLFRDPRQDDPTGGGYATSQNWWIWNATRFFVDLGPVPSGDVRHERVKRIVGRLDAMLAG